MGFVEQYARIAALIDTAHERPYPADAVVMLDQIVLAATHASADIERMFPKEIAALRKQQQGNNRAS